MKANQQCSDVTVLRFQHSVYRSLNVVIHEGSKDVMTSNTKSVGQKRNFINKRCVFNRAGWSKELYTATKDHDNYDVCAFIITIL